MNLRSWLPRRLQGEQKTTRRKKSGETAIEPTPAQLAAKPQLEWIVANRLGSFAMGTVDRVPRRKYHSLLTVREPGVGDALNAVAEVEEWLVVGDKRFALHSYDWGNAIEPAAGEYLVGFNPQPRWTYRVDGIEIERTLLLEPHEDALWLRYAFRGVHDPIQLHLRPVIRHRPLHKLTVANAFLNGSVDVSHDAYAQAVTKPYRDLPPLVMTLHGIDGDFHADGHWFHDVHYAWERSRGYPDAEDLFTPGEFGATVDDDVVFHVRIGVTEPTNTAPGPIEAPIRGESLIAKLSRACNAFLVNKGPDATVIAGYPWFGEWGRDTMICLPGLCLERGRIDEALDILEAYAERRESGLIPNIPASIGIDANLDSIDASLLFIRAVALTATLTRQERVQKLKAVACDLVDKIGAGADSRVEVRDNGLLFVRPGPWAMTWMDAMVDGQPVTPRHGFAVDLNALWIHALRRTLTWGKDDPSFFERWEPVLAAACKSFGPTFWLDYEGYLADTHDGNDPDVSLRPNQLWALALPEVPLTRAQQESALGKVRTHLLTPVGLRTLAADDPRYQATYRGAQEIRDRAYHQGTVWPWLLGIYADAVAQIEGVEQLREELAPVLQRLAAHFALEGCAGSISEVFDGDVPHRPGGAPAQAWSVAELFRVAKMVEG